MRALHQQPYCEKRALTQQSNLKLKENTHRCSWQTQIVQLSWSIGRERVTQSLAAPFGWRLTRIADCQWALCLAGGRCLKKIPCVVVTNMCPKVGVLNKKILPMCPSIPVICGPMCPLANNKTVSKWVSHTRHMPRHTSIPLPMAPIIFQLIWVCLFWQLKQKLENLDWRYPSTYI